MENCEDQVNSFSEVVDNLMNLFGDVMNKDVIAAIVESYDGDLNLSVDAIMNMTNDGNKIEINNQDTTPDTNTSHVTNPQPVQPSSSYASAIQTTLNTGAIPKQMQRPVRPVTHIWTDQVRGIIENHNKGNRIMIVMRGVPGSGKSYLARQLVEIIIGATFEDYENHIFSSDDYFMVRGHYRYDRFKLTEAHTWNKIRVSKATSNGLSPIIIDNTNIEIWEMEPYVRDGVRNGYIIEILEPNTPWARKASLLWKKNIHNVPLPKIKKMLDNFSGGLTGDSLRKGYGLSYPADMVPPVRRLIPIVLQEDELSTTKPHSNETKENVDVLTNTDVTQFPFVNSSDSPTQGNASDKSQTVHDPVLEVVAIEETAMNSESNKLVNKHDENTEELSYEEEARQRLYFEAQKRFEEMEKFVQDWENGENWEEVQNEASTIQKTAILNTATLENATCLEPKPPRKNNTTEINSQSAENLMLSASQCQDWTQISMFMPSWSDDKPSHVTIAQESLLQTVNSGTCMEIDDTNTHNGRNKVITATSRNINEFCMVLPKEKIPVKRMLDKSTMTNEQLLTEAFRCKNEEKHFVAFRKLFKNIARSDLRDIFDNCCGDVNWAVSIVLDGMLNRELKTCEIDELSDPEEESLDQCECLAAYNVIPDVSTSDTQKTETIDAVIEPVVSPINLPLPQKKTKKEVAVSEETLQLKRQIEQNVVIHDSHYSEHCLKIRKFRRGEDNSEQPSTSGVQESTSPLVDQNTEDSDDTISNVSETEGDKIVTVNLGNDFVRELDNMFGRKDMEYPDNIEPTVSVPLHLLNELNALWTESFMYQMEKQAQQLSKLIKEDEVMARDLALKEAEMDHQGIQPGVPDFKEIMDMDLALSLYQKDVAEWRNKEPNDLAAKLSREKLHNLFPDVEKDILSELLMAHDNNFQSTVEVLLVSTGRTDILETEEGINKFIMDKELQRQEKFLDEQRKALSNVEWPLLPRGEVVDLDMVNGYRNEAEEHLTRRNLNYQKAQDYIRRGMTQVANYYSDIATFHKQKFEQANSLAAASLIQMHSQRSSDTTVDLHYLRVSEAKETLDLFIDTHIQKLRETENGPRKNILFFITGRGVHSPGRPRVKPAVKKRLRERGLYFSERNPGLLTAKICADDKLSYQVHVP